MKQAKALLRIYITTVLIFALQKPVFLLIEQSTCSDLPGSIWQHILPVMAHGLTLDLSMAGYLAIVPWLVLTAGIWLNGAIVRRMLNGYSVIASALIASAFVLNLALYPFWGFPLDSTPLYYFFSSPADAFASTSVWFAIGGFAATAMLTAICWLALRVSRRRCDTSPTSRRRTASAALMAALAALMFVAIRGGLSVSAANTGKAYYSPTALLNHAAVNPLFSLMESLSHQEDFASQYRFMSDAEASALLAGMVCTSDSLTQPLLNAQAQANGAPDILIVVMEGFASDLLPSLGSHTDVAVCLDSIAQKSILFTNFFANSFRTDRGLVAVLSGYPAQPMHSIMKYPAKSAHLPSIARSLNSAKGYECTYYYGGDIDFANQRSWLVSQGYSNIVSDANFPIKDKLSKWGVPDHIVANRLMDDIKSAHSPHPQMRVLQTSSSHEPFDVPYHRLADTRLNAFAYTDSVVGNLINRYSQLPSWQNTLVILVPDHVGYYKDNLNNFTRQRYEIPLIITGGAIAGQMKIDTLGSQFDIAATLLAQLGIDHSDFTFSKNLMSPATPKLAFFTVPDAFGFVADSTTVIYDNKLQQVVFASGADTARCVTRGKALLQSLYNDIDKK